MAGLVVTIHRHDKRGRSHVAGVSMTDLAEYVERRFAAGDVSLGGRIDGGPLVAAILTHLDTGVRTWWAESSPSAHLGPSSSSSSSSSG